MFKKEIEKVLNDLFPVPGILNDQMKEVAKEVIQKFLTEADLENRIEILEKEIIELNEEVEYFKDNS